MEHFKVTFYKNGRRLVPFLKIAGMVFLEQFDWDGWYAYHGHAFVQITEEEAIDMALREVQIKHPDYVNRDKVRFKLYEFCLEKFAYGRKAKAA